MTERDIKELEKFPFREFLEAILEVRKLEAMVEHRMNRKSSSKKNNQSDEHN